MFKEVDKDVLTMYKTVPALLYEKPYDEWVCAYLSSLPLHKLKDKNTAEYPYNFLTVNAFSSKAEFVLFIRKYRKDENAIFNLRPFIGVDRNKDSLRGVIDKAVDLIRSFVSFYEDYI